MTGCIERYFPELSSTQIKQFSDLGPLYESWNIRINVISRKDIDNLYERHILHSLGICMLIHFKDGSSVMDVGTGGGFPGIPLAIMFPSVHFHLIDSTGKKLTVASNIAAEIGLENVSFRHSRVEEEKERFDFIVSRAVMPMPDLMKLCRKNISSEQHNALPNGLICLKGGDLQTELKPFNKIATLIELDKYFKEDFFETKKVVYIPVKV
jgi:16S rRNA (guanine527-N7)-methyltransferase